MNSDISAEERYAKALDIAKEHYSYPQNDSLEIQAISKMLLQKLRISIKDERRFIGKFMCTDDSLNILLTGAEEECKGEFRFVGLIMIPGNLITKIEVEED